MLALNRLYIAPLLRFCYCDLFELVVVLPDFVIGGILKNPIFSRDAEVLQASGLSQRIELPKCSWQE
jgi:hypothetical protein